MIGWSRSNSTSQPRPKMIFALLLISMAASCLGNPAMVHEVPEFWESVSPELHPIMKEFSTAVNNAHQSLVKQASKPSEVSICSIMKTTLSMVVQARQALDCGSAAACSPSDVLGNSGHEAIVEATRSCTGSDDLCLIKKLGHLVNTSSLGHVCSALREVEGGLQTAASIFCHEELGVGSCSYWNCFAKIAAAAAHCYSKPDVETCVVDILKAAGSGCADCVCKWLPKICSVEVKPPTTLSPHHY